VSVVGVRRDSRFKVLDGRTMLYFFSFPIFSLLFTSFFFRLFFLCVLT
jgi:hypothetical protein